jgi:cysteine-rich repeat protein
MLVSLTVIIVTATVARNNRQVFNNIEYETSYNLAESRLITAVDALASPEFALDDLLTIQGQDSIEADSCEALVGGEYYCTYDEAGGARRTLLSIEETNVVEAYDIPADNYFDVVLFDSNGNDYRNTISIEWIGQTALELSLIFQDNTGRMRNISDVVDPTFGNDQVYTTKGTGNPTFLTTPIIASGNSIDIDFSRLDSSQVPADSQLRYLRVRSVNREVGTIVTIRPVNDNSLPNQVRRIEALSYAVTNAESAVPVVFTQVPLSPPTPSPLAQAGRFDTSIAPVCGNGIVEGGEYCDDGNNLNNDLCNNSCCGFSYRARITRTETINNPCCPGPSISINGSNVSLGWSGQCGVCFAQYTFQTTGPGSYGPYTLEDGGGSTPDFVISFVVEKRYDVCRAFQQGVCGNGVIDSGEQCDDGNNSNADRCKNNCTFIADQPRCGNGIVEANEECDDGNNENNDFCTNGCLNNVPDPVCGNGIVEAGETCDDGNIINTDTCRNDCSAVLGECTNGILDPGEECDDGDQNDLNNCNNECEERD